jgi:hypothetical protein
MYEIREEAVFQGMMFVARVGSFLISICARHLLNTNKIHSSRIKSGLKKISFTFPTDIPDRQPQQLSPSFIYTLDYSEKHLPSDSVNFSENSLICS